MKQPGVLVLLLTFVLVISFVVASQESKNDGFATTALTGANEVNSLGDADGRGLFKFKVKNQERQLCYELSISSITTPTSATVNLGDAISNGSVILTLNPIANGRSQGCVSSEPAIIADMAANPGRYYVNVMNGEFPNGAIRGQLK